MSADASPLSMITQQKPKVYIVFYSLYGHIRLMAHEVAEGLRESGVDVQLFQVKETLPEDVLTKMRAPPKDDEIPEITPNDLVEADGLMFGIPTRYGQMPAQMKALFDATGQIWLRQGLAGKPAGCFFSTSTLGGGQETTALTTTTQLTHHGMMFVPLGYTYSPLLTESSIHGGSPWGAGCLGGADNSRRPSEMELAMARHHGKQFGTITLQLHWGRQVFKQTLTPEGLMPKTLGGVSSQSSLQQKGSMSSSAPTSSGMKTDGMGVSGGSSSGSIRGVSNGGGSGQQM